MDIPFGIFVMYSTIALNIGILGIWLGVSKRMDGAPFITVFAGFMFLLPIILIQDIQMGYTETEIPEYDLGYPMQIETSNASTDLQNTNHGLAERPANVNSLLYNQPISCINVDMQRIGSPTGDVVIGIMDADSQIIKEFGRMDASDVFTTQTSYKFCLPSHDYWIISLYDRVGVFYNTGSAGNGIRLFVDTTNSYDGTNSIRAILSSGGTWTDSTTSDMRMILSVEELQINKESEPILYAFNQNDIWVFSILLGILFVMTGIMIQFAKLGGDVR